MNTSKKHILLAACLSLLCSLNASGQRRVSADVEVKQVAKQNVISSTKSVFCSNNGRLVVLNKKPMESIIVTNVGGETKTYIPQTNQVLADNSGRMSAKNEYLSLFILGRFEDLGLSLYGYALKSTEITEEGYTKKTFTTKRAEQAPIVEIVYEDYLPIYAAYYEKEGKVASKSYFSRYTEVGRFRFPQRVTDITYVKKDSIVTRTLYSNFVVDGEDSMFDFEVPADAVPIDPKQLLKR